MRQPDRFALAAPVSTREGEAGLVIGLSDCLRRGSAKKGTPGLKRRPAPAPQRSDGGQRSLLCRQCGAEITSAGSRAEVAGGHEHTFVNPAGILFHIACFSAARCLNGGTPTDEFSWFPGFAWRYSVCASCRAHLGWQFLGGDGRTFWGLIVDRLHEEGE